MNGASTIVEFSRDEATNKPSVRFYPERVAEILNSVPNARDKPIMLQAVAGAFRTGKSFLLNLHVSYLEHQKKVSLIPNIK